MRHTLNPQDRRAEFSSVQDLVSRNLIAVYERMQDGRKLGHENTIVSFVAEPFGRARLVGHRRVFARRKGIVPGDIVRHIRSAGDAGLLIES